LQKFFKITKDNFNYLKEILLNRFGEKSKDW